MIVEQDPIADHQLNSTLCFGDLPQLWLATGTKLNHFKFANASQGAVN